MADAVKDDDKDKDWKDRFAKKSRSTKKSDDEDDDKRKKVNDDGDDLEKDSKWAAKGKTRKSDDDGDEDEDDDAKKSGRMDGDEDDSDKQDGDGLSTQKVKKSLDVDTMAKSLNALSGFIQSHDRSSRKDTLLAKAQSGDLQKSERDELFDILGGGGGNAEPPLADTLTKSLEASPEVQNMVDVSEYVASLHDALNKSLRMVGSAIEAMDERQAEFNLLNARSLHHSGSLVKSLAERIGVIEAQPARAPKSRGVTPLNKSFAGNQPSEEALSKSEILDALTSLNEESYSTKNPGLSKSGEDLTRAVAKYEQTTALSPTLANEVRSFVQARRSGR